eukprot:gene10562-biopygen3307
MLAHPDGGKMPFWMGTKSKSRRGPRNHPPQRDYCRTPARGADGVAACPSPPSDGPVVPAASSCKGACAGLRGGVHSRWIQTGRDHVAVSPGNIGKRRLGSGALGEVGRMGC